MSSEKKAKFVTCPWCEASFKLPHGVPFPEHSFCGQRCELSGKAVK